MIADSVEIPFTTKGAVKLWRRLFTSSKGTQILNEMDTAVDGVDLWRRYLVFSASRNLKYEQILTLLTILIESTKTSVPRRFETQRSISLIARSGTLDGCSES